MKFSNIWEHPKSTAIGLLVALMIACPILAAFDWTNVSPAKVFGLLGALAIAFYGALVGKKPDEGGRGAALPLIVFLFLLLAAPAVRAQDVPPPPNASDGFSATSEAMAVRYNGQWSAGTLITQSYDFLDFGKVKGSHVYAQGFEFIAPTPGLNIYAGGIGVQPDMTSLFKKTNLPASNFRLFFHGAAGNGIPSSGGSHISFIVGGGVDYKVLNSLTWKTLQGNYFRLGSNNGAAISTGLAYYFGK